MNNPRTQLRAYFNTLFQRFLNTKSLYGELKRILEWKTKRFEAYRLGAYSFELAEYSLLRTVLVEMSALLSENEERSLIDWLNKAKEHAGSLGPTRYNPGGSRGERQLIKKEEYRAVLDEHRKSLEAQQALIGHIKARRDKVIAHFDKAYF
jgi:hypothetical protein